MRVRVHVRVRMRVHVHLRGHVHLRVHVHVRVGIRGCIQRLFNTSALERSRVLRMRVCGNVNVCEYARACVYRIHLLRACKGAHVHTCTRASA